MNQINLLNTYNKKNKILKKISYIYKQKLTAIALA